MGAIGTAATEFVRAIDRSQAREYWLVVLFHRELDLRRPSRGERGDGRDLGVAGGHDLHAHGGPAEDTDLVEWGADHDAGGRDEENLLAALVDHLHRRDVARLWAERREDDPLAAAALGREFVDRGAFAVAVLRHGQHLGALASDAHADDLVSLPQADARHALG